MQRLRISKVKNLKETKDAGTRGTVTELERPTRAVKRRAQQSHLLSAGIVGLFRQAQLR